MAPDRPNAPPELAAALATFDQFAADHIARARVPSQPDRPSPLAAHGQAGLQPARQTPRTITRCHTRDQS
jgi:hypothetical protein